MTLTAFVPANCSRIPYTTLPLPIIRQGTFNPVTPRIYKLGLFFLIPTGGFFPLGFGRQATACPFTIGFGIVPGNIDDRVILICGIPVIAVTFNGADRTVRVAFTSFYTLRVHGIGHFSLVDPESI